MNYSFFWRVPILNNLGRFATNAEGWFFDVWHKVDTAMEGPYPTSCGENHPYEPIRPGKMRTLLRALRITDYSRYAFVDFGSGKGRSLLIAAGFPFKSVEGIELQRDLHEQAIQNVRSCKHLRLRSPKMQSVCLNAVEYEFPNIPMVLYLYNPFAAEVMQKLVSSLNKSIELHPRDVIVMLIKPQSAPLFDSAPHFALYEQGPNYRFYRSKFS